MPKKAFFLVLLIIVAIGSGILILRFLSGPEDSWICQDGQWVEHGKPLAPKPTTPCGETEQKIIVKVFFNNSEMDPEFSCNKVFPVEREVFKTLAVARSSLEELFKGPTNEEQAQKFFTSINQGVKIQKLTIEDGVAKIDFNDQLEFQVGGSCRVSAIRWQITETLKQFPTIKDVIISINGRTEDILQP